MNVTSIYTAAKKSLQAKRFHRGLLLLCCCAAPTLGMAEQSGDFTYSVSDNKATITSYTGAGGAVVIPELLNGWPVVSVGEKAFYRNGAVTSVTIPFGVTRIENEAFSYCSGLTSAPIPSSVTSIGNTAFISCGSLTSVTIPKSVLSIGIGAFKGCVGLTSLTLADGVSIIGEAAFGDCSSLTSLIIPRSVGTIETNAFLFCDSLGRVDFVGNAPTMGTDVFPWSADDLKLYRSKSASGFTVSPWTGFDMGFNDPPAPWRTKEIGNGKQKGYAIFNAGTFIQAGSGVFGARQDQFYFIHQTLRGDGEITARVKSLENTGSSSSVGVVIRESLVTNSKQVFIGLNGDSSYRFLRRTSNGGQNLAQNKGAGIVPNTWLRLVRKGKLITAFNSVDGKKWSSAGSVQVELTTNCFIGLAVASRSDATLNISQFSNVKVKP